LPIESRVNQNLDFSIPVGYFKPVKTPRKPELSPYGGVLANRSDRERGASFEFPNIFELFSEHLTPSRRRFPVRSIGSCYRPDAHICQLEQRLRNRIANFYIGYRSVARMSPQISHQVPAKLPIAGTVHNQFGPFETLIVEPHHAFAEKAVEGLVIFSQPLLTLPLMGPRS
jgi:hypothetical protein